MYNILSSESGILIFLSGLPALIHTCYFKIIMTRGWLQTQNFALKKNSNGHPYIPSTCHITKSYFHTNETS